MMRLDGRQPGDIRNMEIQMGQIKSLNAGSAYLSFGNTIVLSIVHGLQLSSLGTKVEVDVTFPSINIDNKLKEQRLNSYLSALAQRMVISQLVPYTLIRVSIQVMSFDGSLLSTCANALVASLMDSAIPIYRSSFITIAVDSNDQILLDPIESEELNANSIFVCCEIDGKFEVIYSSNAQPISAPFSIESECSAMTTMMKSSVSAFIESFSNRFDIK